MLELEAFLAFCRNVDSEVSRKAQSLVKSKDFTGLVNLSVDPRTYRDPYTFHLDHIIGSWLKKAEFLKTGIKVKDVAITAFHKAEQQCAETNAIFELRSSGSIQFRPDVELVLSRARRKISWILDGFSFDTLVKESRYGPGATYALRGSDASVDNKVLSTDVTPGAYAYARLLIMSDPLRFEAITGQEVCGPFSTLPSLFSFVEGSRVTTVPKNAKTDRTIAIEPCMNLELQLALGSFIRRRLKQRVGIDLNDQSHNQRAAALAYGWGFATVDLSAASDTISKEVVFDLLPVDFALLLDSVRSKRYRIGSDGEFTNYRKFSSMGNGFTFELESLIFWALSSSLEENGWALVYGDDIVIEARLYRSLCDVLSACGFTVNTDKSYASGSFYESCGKHYFNGKDVTPIYQKEPVRCVPSRVRMANRILRLALRLGDGAVCLRILYDSWSMAVGSSPKVLMPLMGTHGPYEEDSGFAMPTRTDVLDEFLIRLNGRLPSLSFRVPYKAGNEKALYAYALRFSGTSFAEQAVRKDGELRAGVPVVRNGHYVVRRKRPFFGMVDIPWV